MAEIVNINTDKKGWWITPAILLLAVIMAVILVFTMLKPKNDPKQEEIIDLQNRLIQTLEKVNEKSDSIIQYQKAILEGNRAKETTIIREIREVPAKVKNLSKEQLRNEVNNYE